MKKISIYFSHKKDLEKMRAAIRGAWQAGSVIQFCYYDFTRRV